MRAASVLPMSEARSSSLNDRLPVRRSEPARKDPRLNMAYAHVRAHMFSEAADAMYDRMLNMGFGEDEAAIQIQQLELPGMETGRITARRRKYLS